MSGSNVPFLSKSFTYKYIGNSGEGVCLVFSPWFPKMTSLSRSWSISTISMVCHQPEVFAKLLIIISFRTPFSFLKMRMGIHSPTIIKSSQLSPSKSTHFASVTIPDKLNPFFSEKEEKWPNPSFISK